MNIRLTLFICLLIIMSSCKSLQPAWHKNASSSSVQPKKKNTQFLDNVTVVPGEKKNNKYAYKSPAGQNSNQVLNYKSSFNIEAANWLQIKYAIIMNVPVEQLNDLPLLQEIDHWWGTKYCMGGNDETCIDCSAFTQTMLYKVYGVVVPRTAHEQYDFSTRINDADLQEGDLVFFKSGRYISHVGLYIGNNKFVNASTSSGVTISDLNDNYWSKKYAGAGRVRISSTTMKTETR